VGSRLNSCLLFVYTEPLGSKTLEMGSSLFTLYMESGFRMLFRRTIYSGTFIFDTFAGERARERERERETAGKGV